jgi:predicted nucleotidyltransferase
VTAHLTPAEIESIVDRIVRVARPERVLMFGSYAKGKATDRSDLDLLVVVPDDASPRCRPADLAPYLGGWIIPIDVHVVTTEELAEYGKERYHFLHSVLQSGRPLYPREDR